jgi:signal transduction histidine kinase
MFRSVLTRLTWRVLSIPIFPKIIGIGVLVAVLFGGVTLFQTRAGTSHILYQLLEKKIIATTNTLADMIALPAASGDAVLLSSNLDQARKIYPEISYVIVHDSDGQVVASTFKEEIPSHLLKEISPPCPPECGVQSFEGEEGNLYEARSPILDGKAGTVQVGFVDKMVSEELGGFTRTIIGGLLLCVAIGACLALVLTHILTRPIRRLVEAANKIREGKLGTRADVYSNDEIGRLAVAFNQMAESLSKFQQEMRAKEKARISLIEKTVQVQEDERKSISRELHDHLGQSLLAILLQVQAGRNHGELTDSLYEKVEKSIRDAIDEVRRLAWGMRPSILDDYGLNSALARHIDDVSRHSTVVIDYNFTSPAGLERLPSRIEVPLFRIAQEAITNVQRHSDAAHASVVVLRQLHDITLLVEDNGKGFDASIVREEGDKCLGLIGMRERVALLGGSVVIESVPGKGTTIRAKIPLDGDPDAYTDIDR